MTLSWNQTLGSKIHGASSVIGKKIYVSTIPKSAEIVKNFEKSWIEVDDYDDEEEDSYNENQTISLKSTFGKDFEPIPKILKLSSSRQFSSFTFKISTSVDKIPDVCDKNFETILKKKLEICNEIYSFNDSEQNMLIENKGHVLQEILNIFEESKNVQKISLNIQKELFDTLYVNIFEQNPKFPDLLESNFYTVPIVDPTWPHLSLSFDILNSFVSFFPNNKCFTNSLLKRAIYLLSLPDAHVRKAMFSFIKQLLDKRIDFYHVVLKSASEQLQNVVYEVIPPYCAGTLLRLLGVLFTKSNMRPPASFHEIIQKNVLPLLSSRFFSVFDDDFNDLFNILLKPIVYEPHATSRAPASNESSKLKRISIPSKNMKIKPIQKDVNNPLKSNILPPLKKNVIDEVSSCCDFAKKAPERVTAIGVITAINKYWPKTNSTRQLSMLKTMFVILNGNAMNIPERRLRKICKFIAYLIGSPNKKVETAVLNYIIEKPDWMKQKSRLVIESFFFIIFKLKTKEKDPFMNDLLNKAMSSLGDIDKKAFVSASSNIPLYADNVNADMRWMTVFSLAENNSIGISMTDFKHSLKEMLHKGNELSKIV